MDWDVRLSPTVKCRDVGIGTVVKENVGLSERVVEQTAEGIPFTYLILTVFELNDDGKIQHARSYYDKPAIMHQVASKYPGIKGWFFRKTVNMVVAQGERGLERSSTTGG
jgi:hypothetical protein